MKKIVTSLLTIAMTIAASAQITTPQPSPSSKIEQKVGLTDVTLEYSRPGVKGRVIFGDLVPYGKVWRTGANANTKITFSNDVTIAGQTLSSGSYAIYTIPNKGSWEVLFYSDTKNWGTPKKWDDSKVVAKTTVKTEAVPFNIESFSMGFGEIKNSSANLEIIWESTYLAIPFEVPTDAAVMASITKTMNASPTTDDYYSAAVYYLQSNKDISLAKEWIDKAAKLSKDKPRFWLLRQQSLIHAKAGDKKGAIKAAKKSLKLALEKGNADYVKMNKNSLKEWGAKI